MIRISKYRFEMKWYLVLLLLLLTSMLVMLTSVYIQPGSFMHTMKGFVRQPLLILLNFAPGFFIITFLYFILGNTFYSASISALIINLFSYANLLKIEGRDDPLVPADIALIKEALTAASDYKLDLHLFILFLILLCSAILFVMGIFIKNPKQNWKIRLCGSVAVIAVVVFMTKFVYRSTDLYNSFDVPQRYNITSVFNNLGFNYCFLYNFNLYPVEKPDGFSRAEVEKWINAGAAQAPEDSDRLVKPHVLMVMCEAFTDLSDEDVFDYTPEDDPLKNYKKISNSDGVISGHIVVSNFAAGTANTEFDVLTGMQTNMLSDKTTSSFRTVHKNILALPRIYKKAGYESSFMHPGHSWFYNRNSVYKYFGIDDQVFNDAFDSSDFKGPWISDEAFLDELISGFEEKTAENSNPIFSYSVTIQNHQAYTYGKYGFEPPEAPLRVMVSDSSKETIAVYMEGVKDSSNMLLSLTEYLDKLSEPVLLVFFGDHRPNLGNTYKELGIDVNVNSSIESTIRTYETPYIIWQNKAYEKKFPLSQISKELELPKDGLMSSNYLGALVYEITGMTGSDPFFDYLNKMRRELPVICGNNFRLADGSYTNTLSQDHLNMIDKFDKWMYYKIKLEKVS